jgi:thiamine-phosphate pyrophosphorylase
LFTDARLGGAAPGDPLWRALARLPRGGGVVFRHYGWPKEDRRALLARVCAVARRRGLLVVGSGIAAPDGVHRPAQAMRHRGSPRPGLVTASAHSRRELVAAFRAGADLLFLSPLFPTESHPGAQALGPLRFGLLVRGAPGPVAALGGMTAARMRRLKPLGAAGFGAIGFWAAD